MSESVEQAALHRGERNEWKSRAEREAAAIIAEAMPNTSVSDYGTWVLLVAIGWLQGVNVGAHETLHAAEGAFENLRAAL